MGKYWTIADSKVGDEVAALITPTTYVMVKVLKIKGYEPIGEAGNVLVEDVATSASFWILGGKLMPEEKAIKQIEFNKKR